MSFRPHRIVSKELLRRHQSYLAISAVKSSDRQGRKARERRLNAIR
jgi:hypothetical protein